MADSTGLGSAPAQPVITTIEAALLPNPIPSLSSAHNPPLERPVINGRGHTTTGLDLDLHTRNLSMPLATKLGNTKVLSITPEPWMTLMKKNTDGADDLGT